MDRSSRSDSDDLRCSDLRRGQAGRSPVGCYVLGTQPHRIGWNLCQEQANVLPRICETACKAALKKAEYKSSAKKCIQLGFRRFAQNIVCWGDMGRAKLNRFSISHSERYKASRLTSPVAFFRFLLLCKGRVKGYDAFFFLWTCWEIEYIILMWFSWRVSAFLDLIAFCRYNIMRNGGLISWEFWRC